ncbi:hypothetical protein Bca52824_089773 [Brassica carinata]|uniref:Uncharacterized protein n=1 Tax=Brassica carinata TaxID=52824 RepID=A0A8X7NV55_BRACI|nr:hypothetical protein Bca52824_089773 [Brassica carinata]
MVLFSLRVKRWEFKEISKIPNEKDAKGLAVRDCNMSGTTNGIRIKTWANSPGLSATTIMTF